MASRHIATTNEAGADEAPLGKREHIVAAALDVLARDGITRLSLRRVAEHAGVALGLAHYYFESKAALIEAMVHASRARFIARIVAAPPRGEGPVVLRGVLELVRDIRLLVPEWFRLLVDMDSASLHDPVIAAATAANKRAGEASVVQYLLFAAGKLPAEVDDAPALSAVLMAAFDGLAVRAAIDPDFDLQAAYVALERLLLAGLAPGVAPPKRPWAEDPLGIRKATPLRRVRMTRKTRTTK